MKDNIGEVSQGDAIKRRMIFINSFNNAYSYKVVIIDFRLFCFNQMGRINKSKNKLILRAKRKILLKLFSIGLYVLVGWFYLEVCSFAKLHRSGILHSCWRSIIHACKCHSQCPHKFVIRILAAVS